MNTARALLLPLVLALAALVPAPAAAQRKCPAPGGSCFTVTVPLDRAGVVPGTIKLRAARMRSRRANRPPIIGLTGGPGQAGVTFSETYQLIIPSAGRDLIVLDQRGTGASGLLRCRGFERRLGTSFTVPAGACGRALGPRRSFYTSADSAQDLEALRVRIGAQRIALYGVSYGTRVALEYARRYPQRVERMILDSPIGLEAPDPLARETLGAVRRVVSTACRRGCRGASGHPVADIARLRQRLRRSPIRRMVRRGGRRVPVRFDADDLLGLLIIGDLDPDLLRAIPRAVRLALGGRSGALARLKVEANAGQDGGRLSEFSPALFAATTCEESPLAWDPAADLATRRAQAREALDATPAQALAPFDRAAALEAGLLPLCGDWPVRERPLMPEPPLPVNTRTLILSGELDLRTPLENARQLAKALPRSSLVIERDTGHGVLGSAWFGCAEPATKAFLALRKLPPCRRATGVRIDATAARSARDRPRAPVVR